MLRKFSTWQTFFEVAGMDQHWKEVAQKLPKQPCDDLKQSVLMDIYDNGDCLGQSLLLFHREAVTLMDEIQELMGPGD